MKSKSEMSAIVATWAEGVRIKRELGELLADLHEKDLPEIDGFFDRGEASVLPLLVREYGVPDFVLRADETIRNRWEQALLSGEALSDNNHPAWKGSVSNRILKSLRRHMVFESQHDLFDNHRPWEDSERGTASECLEFMDHQVALFYPNSSSEHDVFVELSCQLIQPGGAMSWNVVAHLLKQGTPRVTLTGKLLSVDTRCPLTLNPKEVFSLVDADFPGQYLSQVVDPLLDQRRDLGDHPMDLFCEERLGSALLHVDHIDCLEDARTDNVVLQLFEGLQAVLDDPERYDFDVQVKRGLVWDDRLGFAKVPDEHGLTKATDPILFEGVGIVVIESPLADMIEMAHHLRDPDQLREAFQHTASVDTFLSNFVKHLQKHQETYPSGLPSCYTYYIPTLEGERVVRIGEQSLLRSLESDLFDEGN